MKRKLLVGVLAVFATVGLASCNDTPTVKSLSISGQDVEFTVGETFNVGDLKVTATMSDNTTVDVTDKVTVEEDVDMNTPGSYAVLISYEGQVITYQIKVVAEKNVATLDSINVDSDGAKTYYLIGEEFSTEGLVVYETYKNSTGPDTVSVVTDLSKYTVTVTDENASSITSAFTEYGFYTVTVASGELTDSFTITVGEKVYSTVTSALEEGMANSSKVNGGFITIDTEGYVQEYEYAFGQKYTKVVSGDDENHYELLEDGTVFGVNCYVDYEGNLQSSYIYEPGEETLLGVDLSAVFSYEYTVYGVDEMLNKLVELATSDAATNYVESFDDYCPICGMHKSYSFSFDVVMGEYNPAEYNFDVNFKIDDASKAISDISIVISATNYLYNDETGEYVPNTEATAPDYVKYVTVQQEIGERNIVNEYSASSLKFESFELVDAEQNPVVDGATIDIKVGGKAYLYLNNVTPETANPNIDVINVDVTTETGDQTWNAGGSYDSEEGYVYIYSYKTGKYNVTVSTANVTYNYVLNVDYAELTDFAPALYDKYGEKYEAYYGNTYVNQGITFTAYVNANANPNFTATLAEETNNATLENFDGDYLFTASVVGEYVINLVSTINEELTSTLVITVEEAPNMSEIINGKYTYDYYGTIISYVFTPSTEGALDGTLVINSNNTDYNFTYTYYESFNSLQVLPVTDADSACEWSVSVDNYELCCLYYGVFNYGPLTKDGSTSGDDTSAGTKDSPIVLVAGDYVANVPQSEYVYYTYTATTDTEITITITSASFFFEYGTFNFDLCNWGFNNVLTQSLTAGQTLYFKLQTETGDAGVVEFTVTLPQSEVEDTTGEGTAEAPFVLELGASYSANAFIEGYIFYTYTATTDINVMIEVISDDYWFEYGTYGFGLCDNVNSTNPTMNVTLTAGQTLYVKVSTYNANEAVVDFKFNESTQTGGDDVETPTDAVEIIASTTPMAASFLDKETVTYVTTISGGNSGCFGLYGELESYFITITFDTDLVLYGGSPRNPMTYTSGQVIEVLAGDGFIFWFDNSVNLTDAVVTFTITIQ